MYYEYTGAMRFLSMLLAVTPLVWAQAPAPPVVLKSARMFDGQSSALTSPGLVVVAGNKIIGVGASAQIPHGAQIIDLGNSTLLP